MLYENYNKTIELKVDLVNAYTNRGAAYHEKGKCDLAIIDFTKVIELEPDDADGHITIAP